MGGVEDDCLLALAEGIEEGGDAGTVDLGLLLNLDVVLDVP